MSDAGYKGYLIKLGQLVFQLFLVSVVKDQDDYADLKAILVKNKQVMPLKYLVVKVDSADHNKFDLLVTDLSKEDLTSIKKVDLLNKLLSAKIDSTTKLPLIKFQRSTLYRDYAFDLTEDQLSIFHVKSSEIVSEINLADTAFKPAFVEDDIANLRVSALRVGDYIYLGFDRADFKGLGATKVAELMNKVSATFKLAIPNLVVGVSLFQDSKKMFKTVFYGEDKAFYRDADFVGKCLGGALILHDIGRGAYQSLGKQYLGWTTRLPIKYSLCFQLKNVVHHLVKCDYADYTGVVFGVIELKADTIDYRLVRSGG